MGMLHSWWQLSQATLHGITNLRSMNPHVASILDVSRPAASAAWAGSVPRQDLPSQTPVRGVYVQHSGISSFAFQASYSGHLMAAGEAPRTTWQPLERLKSSLAAGHKCAHAAQPACRASSAGCALQVRQRPVAVAASPVLDCARAPAIPLRGKGRKWVASDCPGLYIFGKSGSTSAQLFARPPGDVQLARFPVNLRCSVMRLGAQGCWQRALTPC